MEARKPAMSPTTPPPRAMIASLRSNCLAIMASARVTMVVMFFDFSPAGKVKRWEFGIAFRNFFPKSLAVMLSVMTAYLFPILFFDRNLDIAWAELFCIKMLFISGGRRRRQLVEFL